MIISLNNLHNGICWWKKGKWAPDLLNAEYYDIYNLRANGITKAWWATAVDWLSRWRAYRGSTPPNTKAEILKSGYKILDKIRSEYTCLIGKSSEEPSITAMSWDDVATLFALAQSIKPKSPVFAGKMCHFVFPKLFIVMDNLATEVFDYEFYWRRMQDEWQRFQEKAQAQKQLIQAINGNKPLHPHYPLETKIMELCHIGYKHR
jgi:hypothetical protein